MDVHESEQASQKQTLGEIQRPPLAPPEKTSNNGGIANTRRSKTREVVSRYRSPSPSAPFGPKRCPSPNLTRTTSSTSISSSGSSNINRTNSPSSLVQKRAHSVERNRPSTPPEILRRTGSSGGRSVEGLWPSTMRSLSVSFQSDSISIPISKREKPVTRAIPDRTLKPSSNVAQKQREMSVVRKQPTPERKRSPLKGKNLSDQSENSKPVIDSSHARLMDQHRWPSRTGGKVSPNVLNKSIDITNMNSTRSSFLRVPVNDGPVRPLLKSSSDVISQLSFDGSGRGELDSYAVDDISRRLSERMSFGNYGIKTQSLPTSRSHSRPASPNKNSSLSSSVLRGVSPSHSRPSTPPSRGMSPSRIRATSTSIQTNNSTSVLSFIADLKKGKKAASQIEDAHQLRLLYNRLLQWRFVNARADAALDVQRMTAETTLYNVWDTILALLDLVVKKRIILQQLKLELKLNAVLNNQMAFLDDWALLERDHAISLSGTIEDLEASTLRLPVTGGAKADIETIKAAICSAGDIMQAMGFSLCSLLSRVESMNRLVSGLAGVVSVERGMLGECETLLAAASAMQVEEYSIRSHLIQYKQDLTKNE